MLFEDESGVIALALKHPTSMGRAFEVCTGAGVGDGVVVLTESS